MSLTPEDEEHVLKSALEAVSGTVKHLENKKERDLSTYRDDRTKLLVSTVYIFDGFMPYETAVGHPEYNQGHLVIVQAYPDVATAVDGHHEWIAKMTREPLPEFLEDCCNIKLSRALRDVLHQSMCYPRQKGEA